MENHVFTVYHGSSSEVKRPDLTRGREDVDFGIGFYTSTDRELAAKWACRKYTSIVNEYTLDTTNLKVDRLGLTREWLDFVVANRTLEPIRTDADIIIGPIADDRLFNTIEMYEDGYINAEKAVSIMNCMEYGEQIVLKTERALDSLKFEKSRQLQKIEKESYKKIFVREKKIAIERTSELLREMR